MSQIASEPAGTAVGRIPELSVLASGLEKSGLKGKLDSAKDVTIFAPNNSAFESIPEEARKKLMENKQELAKIISYHVVEGKVTPAELESGKLKTMQGGELTVKGTGENLTVNDAKVVCGDVPTSNATIYIIDKVLMPQ
ncbi:fasciclin domain-containing protein [Nonomuraea sp. MG754425]|uniref:fasciclin domain-containing protein n=1 Tax=Nonomuraea sp. MG754425 TaxID=2570319 RepID=UPI001F1D3676|nr:fasciclin domain-containing protein [Nonomuraea sp. MG754425]MCF6468413.1 fasciclin domain-containing protein [Nonomuraea sp. MG754425]